MIITRRSFLRGLVAAPLIVSTPGLLMKLAPQNPLLDKMPEFIFGVDPALPYDEYTSVFPVRWMTRERCIEEFGWGVES